MGCEKACTLGLGLLCCERSRGELMLFMFLLVWLVWLVVLLLLLLFSH